MSALGFPSDYKAFNDPYFFHPFPTPETLSFTGLAWTQCYSCAVSVTNHDHVKNRQKMNNNQDVGAPPSSTRLKFFFFPPSQTKMETNPHRTRRTTALTVLSTD